MNRSLQTPELLAQTSTAQVQPKRPVIYASVRASPGVVNNCGVGLNSINCPISRNAVKSLTRAACCMLCVTITIVQRSFNCTNNSSIFAVLMGSSAEHGSSSNNTPRSPPTTPPMEHPLCHRQGSRDAQPLLLTAGKFVRRFVQMLLYFVPQRRVPQALFHRLRN